MYRVQTTVYKTYPTLVVELVKQTCTVSSILWKRILLGV